MSILSAGHKNSLMYCSEVGASGISGIFQDLGLILYVLVQARFTGS